MCAKCSNRRAFQWLHIRSTQVRICETCSAELYRAGLIMTQGAALVVVPARMMPRNPMSAAVRMMHVRS